MNIASGSACAEVSVNLLVQKFAFRMAYVACILTLLLLHVYGPVL